LVAFAAGVVIAAGLAIPTAWRRQLGAAEAEFGVPLNLKVDARQPKQPPSWGGAYRVDLGVTNQGPNVPLQAKMRAVRGREDTDYSRFLLQWDLRTEPDVELFRDDSHWLHLLWTQDRAVRFLGPETSAGQGLTACNEFKAHGDVWFEFELRDITTGRSVDHDHKPVVEILAVKGPPRLEQAERAVRPLCHITRKSAWVPLGSLDTWASSIDSLSSSGAIGCPRLTTNSPGLW
jgi:hypothetical protein